MAQDKSQDTTPMRGPAKGAPDDQTPAVEHAGQYTGEKQKQDQSQSSEQPNVEGSPNQGTESR